MVGNDPIRLPTMVKVIRLTRCDGAEESMSSDGRGPGVLPDRGELDTLPGRRIFNTVFD